MEAIIITNNTFKAFVHFSKEKIFGYKFYNDNTFEPINTSILDYFKFLLLSDNKKKLPNQAKYEVYLDNETKYKHFFFKGKEDYDMFFNNNGEDANVYKKSPYKRKTNTRTFYYKGSRITITNNKIPRIIKILIALMVLTSTTVVTDSIIDIYKATRPITYKQLHQKIASSINLSEEDKEYLCNREFIELVLPIINESNANKYLYNLKFNNISIASYENEPESDVIGWYSPNQPNVINIDEEEDHDKTVFDVQYLAPDIMINKKYMSRNDTLSHEFVHLCQIDYGYKLIIEACAEIISNEFYDYTKHASYFEEVKLTKKLMEIIGPDPIWYYNFSGDFRKIEEAVKPFLADKDFLMFKTCLRTSTSFEDAAIFEYKAAVLDILLNTLYLNKYGKEAHEDAAIYALDNNKVMDRWYFNPKYTNDPEKSLYYENTMDFEEAFNRGYMVITYSKNGGVETPFATFQEFVLSDEDPEYDIKIKFSEGVTVKNSKVICTDGNGTIEFIPPISDKDFSIGLSNTEASL